MSHPNFLAGFSNDKSLGGETASVLIMAVINRRDFFNIFAIRYCLISPDS